MAETTSPSVITVDGALEIGTSVENVVVPHSDRGSATINVGSIPSSVTAATIEVKGSDAFRETELTASFDGNKTKTTVLRAEQGTTSTATVRVPIPAENNGTLTLVSSRSTINVTLTLVDLTQTAPAPAPAPPVQTAPAPVPAPEAEPTNPAPVAEGTPGSSNTGVPAGTALTVHNGDIVASTPGQVISGLDIRGSVQIAASDVTIKNSIIRGRSVSGTTPLIKNLDGHARLQIVDTELAPSNHSPYVMGIYGYNFTATRVDIHHVIDAVHITGGNVTLEKSWLHDNLHYSNDPNHGGSPSHDDSIQIQRGNNIRIVGNNISGAHNAAVQITQDSGKVSNVTFANNLAGGGGCTLNIAQKDNGPILGVALHDNKFLRDTGIYNCAVVASPATQFSLARNVFVPDNTPIEIREGR